MGPAKGYVVQGHSDPDSLVGGKQECVLMLQCPSQSGPYEVKGLQNSDLTRVNVKPFHQLGS